MFHIHLMWRTTVLRRFLLDDGNGSIPSIFNIGTLKLFIRFAAQSVCETAIRGLNTKGQALHKFDIVRTTTQNKRL